MATKNDTKATADDAAEVATIDSGAQGVGIPDWSAGYTSIKGTDFATRKRVAQALTNAESLADHLGKTLEVVDIVTVPITVESREGTGEVNDDVRFHLLLKDGTVLAASGSGIRNSMTNIFMSMGDPSGWPEPLTVKATEARTSKGRFYRLEIV